MVSPSFQSFFQTFSCSHRKGAVSGSQGLLAPVAVRDKLALLKQANVVQGLPVPYIDVDDVDDVDDLDDATKYTVTNCNAFSCAVSGWGNP